MTYLVEKFKGKYRIVPPIALNTNDFPKKIRGSYEDIDLYILCRYGNQVTYYGSDILQAYIPSLVRGNNILKRISELGENMIFDIHKTDGEITFKFKEKDADEIIPFLKPYMHGCNVNPFSSKNRPKTKYLFPAGDLEQYKALIQSISPTEKLRIPVFTQKEFMRTLGNEENIKADMKKRGLTIKEYIHATGQWDNYLKYLKSYLEKGE